MGRVGVTSTAPAVHAVNAVDRPICAQLVGGRLVTRQRHAIVVDRRPVRDRANGVTRFGGRMNLLARRGVTLNAPGSAWRFR